MNLPFQIYVTDTETTGLEVLTSEILELTLYHINQERSETWYLKPDKPENASPDALRVNGHKLADISHQTEEGRKLYQDPAKVIIDIENWINKDNNSSELRLLVGHNVGFDMKFLQTLWSKHNYQETFPFGARPHYLDTMQAQLFIDLIKGEKLNYYNLGSLVEKYGVKKLKAHASLGDTIMCKDVFLKQLKILKIND